MTIDRQSIKQYLSQLNPVQLVELVTELRADWQLPEPTVVVPDPRPEPAKIVGYDVVLEDLGPSRVATIRTLRERLGVDLRGARALISPLPAVIREQVSETEAAALCEALREAGATAVSRPVSAGT